MRSADNWTQQQDVLLEGCLKQWSRVIADDRALVHLWQEALDGMQATMIELQLAGRWVRGGRDLLTIVGLNRWELAHSAALAWLLDPYGSHSLGTRFLAVLADRVGAVIATTERIDVRVEESRTTSAGETTRADVVVAGETWTLVIEVKVDAGEGTRQAARLFECWSPDPQPTFVFLTRTGHPPTTTDADCHDAWVPVSWRWVTRQLDTLIRTSSATGTATGTTGATTATALTEYLHTLKGTFL